MNLVNRMTRSAHIATKAKSLGKGFRQALGRKARAAAVSPVSPTSSAGVNELEYMSRTFRKPALRTAMKLRGL